MKNRAVLILGVMCIMISSVGCGTTEAQEKEVALYNTKTEKTIAEYEKNVKAASEVNADLLKYLTKGVISDKLYKSINLNENSNVYIKEQSGIGNVVDNEKFDKRFNECQVIFSNGYEDEFYTLWNNYLSGDFDYYNESKSWYFDANTVNVDVITTGMGASTTTELVVITGMQKVSMKVKVYWYNGKIQRISRKLNNIGI